MFLLSLLKRPISCCGWPTWPSVYMPFKSILIQLIFSGCLIVLGILAQWKHRKCSDDESNWKFLLLQALESEKQRPDKWYSRKVHKEVRESENLCSFSYSSVRPMLNNKPDLSCHASVSQLKTPWVRSHPLLSSLARSLCLFISGSISKHARNDDQSSADRSDIIPRGAESEMELIKFSKMERFSIQLNVFPKAGEAFLPPIVGWRELMIVESLELFD